MESTNKLVNPTAVLAAGVLAAAAFVVPTVVSKSSAGVIQPLNVALTSSAVDDGLDLFSLSSLTDVGSGFSQFTTDLTTGFTDLEKVGEELPQVLQFEAEAFTNDFSNVFTSSGVDWTNLTSDFDTWMSGFNTAIFTDLFGDMGNNVDWSSIGVTVSDPESLCASINAFGDALNDLGSLF